MAISTIDSLRNALGMGKKDDGLRNSAWGSLGQQGMQNNLQSAMGITQEGLEDGAYSKYPSDSLQRQYQDAYFKQQIAYKQRELEIRQREAFEREVFSKGAVNKEDMSSFAFTEPLSVVRDLWCAADLGGKWVDPNKLEASHKLMFERLRRNNMFEMVDFADEKRMTVLTFYRLKE
jgi:hypothetical protein